MGISYCHHWVIIVVASHSGQEVVEHSAPDSPVYLVVLQGQGYFTGGEGQEAQFGPNNLLIFEPGEEHAIRAGDEELVFVAFLHGASNWK